ncbi:MAG TPA: nucleoside deaminase [Roseiflexaceae bacterium]|nr:nucleoside deaminase [Roseiflexaceae bacterium]
MTAQTATDEYFLRQAIAQAWAARRAGEEPIGAVLVLDGMVVAEAHNRDIARSDPTQHAELILISEYCRAEQRLALDGFTLYTSAEPCVMCSGAIKWARISRVVFSVSQAMLQQHSGGRLKPSCASIINSGYRQIEIVGPLLAEEGLAVLDGHNFGNKTERREAAIRPMAD